MYVDSNIFIFAFLDTTEIGELARKFLSKLETNTTSAATSLLAFDETIWIIRKYKGNKEAAEAWRKLLEIPNLNILSLNPQSAFRVADLMEKYNLKPRDAMHLAIAIQHGISTILTEDADFDKISNIKTINLKQL